jgi:hypothetical protein
MLFVVSQEAFNWAVEGIRNFIAGLGAIASSIAHVFRSILLTK